MLLIAVEGVDCSGKTSLIKKLVDEYPEQFEKISFPDRTTKTGKILNEFLKNNYRGDKEKMHMLFHLNRIECQQKIKEILKHKNVICDRYITSGIVYALADNVQSLQSLQSLLIPDLQIYLDASISEISKRAGFGEEKFEIEEFQEKVKNYLKKKSRNKLRSGLK